jgi:cell division protein FtsZ
MYDNNSLLLETIQKRVEDDLGGIEIIGDDYKCPQDEHIAKAAQMKRVRIRIAGCGGAGSNTITRLYQMGIEGADLLAINTDANHLEKQTRSKAKLLIGYKRTRGLGSGGLPKVGEDAAMEDISKIRELMRGSDIAFITCGLGGGTGTGAAPIVAKAAKESGAIVISIVTLPFKSEGKFRMDNAMHGLEKLSRYSDTILTIPNDKLLTESPSKNTEDAFRYADSIMTRTMKGLTELITKTGLINVDFADVANVLKAGGAAMVGYGESARGENRIMDALNQAISFPLIEADISHARGCIVSVTGGPDMTVKEHLIAMTEIHSRIHPDATIKWGARVEKGKENKIGILVLMVGIKSPFVINRPEDISNLEKIILDKDDSIGVDMIR